MKKQRKRSNNPLKVAILGAGVSGLCMAIKLKQAGFDDITIYDKEDDIGGTWRDNSYPGCSCDVPMYLYQYSFEMLPNWTHKFVSADEIKGYLDHVVEKYDLRHHIQLGREITDIDFNEATGFWTLAFADGSSETANIFIAGSGQLHWPRWPDIKGREQCKLPSWHSAQWNHNVSLRGKRVGVIGNGASAIQFVPEIAKQIGEEGKLHIFQRSASWVLPRLQRKFFSWEKWFYRYLPWAMNFQRYKIYWQGELFWIALHKLSQRIKNSANHEMRLYLKDAIKQKKLTPDYDPGCKRVLFANDWWPTVAQDNVEIDTNPIESIKETSIQTAASEVPLDVLIYSTGFRTTDFLGPIKMTGLANRSLKSIWSSGAEAHLGITVHGFPNFFMLYGPNTNLGHNSIIFMIECQANYITQCVEQIDRKDLLYMDVKAEAQRTHNKKVQAYNAQSVFASGCTSWYKTSDGKITNNWAHHTFYYWWQTRKIKLSDFTCRKRDDGMVMSPISTKLQLAVQ